MKKTDRIYDYYNAEFADDSLAKKINPQITFQSVRKGMKAGIDIYQLIGVGDSIVRERIMSALADLYHNGDYNYIYNLWLYGKEVQAVDNSVIQKAAEKSMRKLKLL